VEEALTCTIQGQSRIRDGQSLRLGVDPKDAYLFDEAGHAFPRLANETSTPVSAAS